MSDPTPDSLRIAVASGKGGTGKTTVAVSLAKAAGACLLADFDVESPNVQIFIGAEIGLKKAVFVEIPEVDRERCTLCGRCVESCAFGSLLALPRELLVFHELCHSCGLCYEVCSQDALTPVPREIGFTRSGCSEMIELRDGELNVGEPRATPVIDAVKDRCHDSGIQIWDCPPGTSCPAVAALRGSDYGILVTEPTPVGVHDLRLALSLTDRMRIPTGVVINRCGIGSSEVKGICEGHGVEILAEFPFDRKAASALAKGGILYDLSPEWRKRFDDLWKRILGSTGRPGSDC